jgi:predicted DNA-binding transcriptional regulator AlpA
MISNDRFISVKQVSDILGIGVSTAWFWQNNKPDFPQAIKFSTRCTRWSLAEINSFAESMKATRH